MTRRDVLSGGFAAAALGLRANISRAEPPRSEAGAVRTLRAGPAQATVAMPTGASIPIAGYDGIVPGPPLRARRGKAFHVRLINALSQPTAIHWHGIRGPNAMDGAPPLTQVAVAPGESFDYRFDPPDAGTFWYHAAPSTAAPRGLYGLLIVEEPEPAAVEHDIAVVLDEWAPAQGPPIVTANGQRRLDIPVRTGNRLRLRLLNAGAGIMAVQITQHEPVVVAIDGQPAEPFAAREGRVLLGPGNRVDLILDAGLLPGATAAITAETGAGSTTVGRIVYDEERAPRPAPVRRDPPRLPPNPLPDRIDLRGALRSDLTVTGTGRGLGPPLLSTKRGRAVVLAVKNATAMPHVVHVHGHAFRLLDALDDGWKPFWLDTLVVPPRQTMRIAFVADNPGRWLIERRQVGDAGGGTPAWFMVT